MERERVTAWTPSRHPRHIATRYFKTRDHAEEPPRHARPREHRPKPTGATHGRTTRRSGSAPPPAAIGGGPR